MNPHLVTQAFRPRDLTPRTSDKKVTPMQTAASRLNFCDRYFAAVGARTVYKSQNYREYELPRDVDKELTERPFYWKWVEQTGQNVPPTVLRMAFDEEAEQRENARVREKALQEAAPYLTDIQKQYFIAPKVELVTLGSYRLDKLYDSSLARGRFASVVPERYINHPDLVPWLMVNCLVSFRCDIREQTLLSIGVCLENGQRLERFHDMIENIEMGSLNPKQVNSRMKLSIGDGFERIKAYLMSNVTKSDHQWASEANERLERELAQLKTYYDSLEDDDSDASRLITKAERERKIEQVIARGAPKIEIEMTQVALVGLADRGQ